MNKKINRIISILTVIALGLSIFIGFVMPEFASNIKFFGSWFISCLKKIIGPVIFLSMSLFVLNNDKRSKFLVAKTVGLFVVMFVATFLMSSLIISIIRPGRFFTNISSGTTNKFADFGFLSIIRNLLPKSFDDVLNGKSIFFIIVISLLSAFIVSKTKAKEKYRNTLFNIKKYVDLVLNVFIWLSPLAVLSLVSNMIVDYDVATFKIGLTYILFAYGLSLLTIVIVMILPVWFIAKINPIKYIRKVSKVWLMTISTCSSAATLPYTIRVCNEEFGVDERITDLVVPLGCTIHMCGGAVSFSLLGLFVAQLSGTTVTIPMFLLMLLSATLINMAAPGIPGGGVVIGMTYLSIFSFPFEMFYGIYVGMYKFLDMSYTTLNVTGDISANILLDYAEKHKALKKDKNKASK